MKIFTRQQIINIWLSQNKFLNSYCCPNCRDVMDEIEKNKFKCSNYECGFFGKILEKDFLGNDGDRY